MHSYIVETVADLLVQQPNLQLPIDPRTLIHPKRFIIVNTLDDYFDRTPAEKSEFDQLGDLEDGLTIVTRRWEKTIYLVLYNPWVKTEERIKFTVAHELGHIYLEHTRDAPAQEKKADIFAAELLAPRCLLWELRQRYRFVPPEVVQNTFGLTKSMAKRRLDHRYPRPKDNTAEKKLLQKMKYQLPRPEARKRK